MEQASGRLDAAEGPHQAAAGGGEPSDAMTYKSVRFENIGPIAAGEVRRHPVNVFIGHTGSGKSIAARIIHGVCSIGTPRSASSPDDRPGGGGPDAAAAGRAASRMGRSIIKSAGIPAAHVPTHGAQSSSLEVVADAWGSRKIDCMGLGREPAPGDSARPLPEPDGGQWPSIYVPAGRTGIVQSHAGMALGGGAAPADAPAGTASAGGAPAGGRAALPGHLAPLYGAIFQSLAGSPTETGARIVSRVFGGSLGGRAGGGIAAATYTGIDGFTTGIASAASGVLSSLPAVECMESIRKGGLLVVEEPEAHLDPARQLLLIDEMAKAARDRRLDLILTIHSDHALDSVQSLVATGTMGPGDLGLYYFELKDGPHSRIRQVQVNEDGTAEQDMIEDAIEMLSRRFI